MADVAVSSVTATVRRFVTDNFLLGGSDIGYTDSDSFVGSGIIDSTGIMELVMFVEEAFDIVLDDSELIPENLDSVESVAAFVDRKQAEQNG